MQYGPIPENLFERVALWSGKAPLPLMDALFSIMKARCLMAAVRLGIFEALAAGPRKASELAAELHLEPITLELLLRSIAWGGYIEKTGSRFRLSKVGRKTMVAGSSMDMTGFLQFNYVQWRMVETMENLLQTGRGVDFHKTMTDPNEWAWYQKAMLDVARFHAPILAKSVPVRKGASQLLDVAGSHGLLGAAICRRHPPMRSTVVDLPIAIEHARALAKTAGIADVVEHRAGDITKDELGHGNDVALVANIAHHFLPDQNIALLKRIRATLTGGATVAIWDLETPDSESDPGVGDGTALFFRLTSTALCYSGKEYSRWLRESGYNSIRIARPAMAPGYILVVGRSDA